MKAREVKLQEEKPALQLKRESRLAKKSAYHMEVERGKMDLDRAREETQATARPTLTNSCCRHSRFCQKEARVLRFD